MSPPPAPVRGYPLQLLDELRKDDTSHSSVPSCGMKLCFQPRFAGKEHDVAQPPPRSKRRLVWYVPLHELWPRAWRAALATAAALL